jgi:hypothetical protein
MADHGLAAEDELIMMRETIERLQVTISSVKLSFKEPNQDSELFGLNDVTKSL